MSDIESSATHRAQGQHRRMAGHGWPRTGAFQAERVRMAAYERRIIICEFLACQIWAGGWRSNVTVNSAVSTTLWWMTHTPIVRGRLDRLIDGFTSGLIEKAEFESRITPLRERYDRGLVAMSSLRGELHDSADVNSAEKALSQLANEVESQLDSADGPLQRQLIQLLIKRIEIHEDEVRIVYRVPQNPFCPKP